MAELRSVPLDLNWTVYAGDRNQEAFEVTSNDPVDLTGAVIDAQARKTPNDPAIAIQALVTPIDLTLGRFTVEWDGEALRVLLAGEDRWSGSWDLQIKSTGVMLPTSLLKGTFTVIHDVTRQEALS